MLGARGDGRASGRGGAGRQYGHGCRPAVLLHPDAQDTRGQHRWSATHAPDNTGLARRVLAGGSAGTVHGHLGHLPPVRARLLALRRSRSSRPTSRKPSSARAAVPRPTTGRGRRSHTRRCRSGLPKRRRSQLDRDRAEPNAPHVVRALRRPSTVGARAVSAESHRHRGPPGREGGSSSRWVRRLDRQSPGRARHACVARSLSLGFYRRPWPRRSSCCSMRWRGAQRPSRC